ncbi:aromatic ring-hydroxylating dioxygenase subunit alpha [Alteromonas lipolytica]|uniref:Rieske domain-containing protein n=1 Tax=Alteromonas lipolytica TaxID=1856405 RepID=A0A1E8FAI3_9ALTE|nr:aromatic ring-hydroxylating dioxygenase subunit alpha [Alteromonas lipolytica]OFI32934.1 hypothetical protein BFC17_01260 [Alteromonas lipolytica]GGF64108.1 (2Fe-2S)-binding protein [Alteromonas lipolytica]
MFLEDCWYVGAWSHEVKNEKIVGVKILNQPVALYRLADGTLRAIADRCPHRFAPLSMGCVEGQSIRCMYHGLKFDSQGNCQEIPGGGPLHAIKPARVYPVTEQDGWIWVWMGLPELADKALVPSAFGLDNPAFYMRSAQLDYAANYMLINDNLCDLSHVDFVHAKTLGWATGGGWSTTNPDISKIDRGIRIQRWFVSQPTSPTNPTPVDTWNAYDFLAPGVFVMESKSYKQGTAAACDFKEPTGEPQTYRVEQQAVTPISENETRYFYATGFDSRMPEKLLEGIFKIVMDAFAEDKTIIEAQQKIIESTPDDMDRSFIPHDRALTRFRRMMEHLKSKQQRYSSDDS